MQEYADIYLLLNYSTCFGRPSRPSSGVYKIVFAASGTDLNIWEATFFKRDQVRSVKCKGKAVQLQAWSGPEGSRKLGSQIS